MRYDEIGYWSEVKLDIVRDYAAAYSTIIKAQKDPSLYHIYIDAFAGAGVHVSIARRDWVPGSPLNALGINPPFREYHLIDLDGEKIESLRGLTKDYANVELYKGDCNKVLLDEVFPKARYEDYRRAFCLLDPYGLHLRWRVIEQAGKMRSIEVFLNFPVADMNRNVLWRNPDRVDSEQATRMTEFSVKQLPFVLCTSHNKLIAFHLLLKGCRSRRSSGGKKKLSNYRQQHVR